MAISAQSIITSNSYCKQNEIVSVPYYELMKSILSGEKIVGRKVHKRKCNCL